jgi:predicted small secreted protein
LGIPDGGNTPSKFRRAWGEIAGATVESALPLNMKTTIQRLGILFFSLLLLAVSSLGCKTAEGFGKDMENAGEGIQKGVK